MAQKLRILLYFLCSGGLIIYGGLIKDIANGINTNTCEFQRDTLVNWFVFINCVFGIMHLCFATYILHIYINSFVDDPKIKNTGLLALSLHFILGTTFIISVVREAHFGSSYLPPENNECKVLYNLMFYNMYIIYTFPVPHILVILIVAAGLYITCVILFNIIAGVGVCCCNIFIAKNHTPQQIPNATPPAIPSALVIDIPDRDTECPICFEQLNENTYIILYCGHILCKECRGKIWRCPLCRAVLMESVC